MEFKKYLLSVKQGLLKEKSKKIPAFYVCMGSYVENFEVVKTYKNILAATYDICAIHGERAIKDFEEKNAIFYSSNPGLSYIEIQRKFFLYKEIFGISEALEEIINEYIGTRER